MKLAPFLTHSGEGKLRFSFLFFVSCFFTLSAWGSELGNSAAWRALLHFPKGAELSLIDDPSFFLSPNGHRDPAAELRATIEVFSQHPESPGNTSPQCRWAGRYRWLQRHAPEFATNFVPQSCPDWDLLRQRAQPHSATLVFPDGYMNSPASMFGHTLLRIDQIDPQPLRSFAVNYAAHTAEDNGIAYAFNGLSGRYKGYFSLMPYPDKLKEYQFGEQRDIWEYRLTLSPEETSAMLEHLWDLQNTYAYYYFFDRNCSFQLLALIEAVRPSLDLLSGWGVSVIPTDTIRRLVHSDLVDDTQFRPSQATQLQRYLLVLSDQEVQAVKALSKSTALIESIDLPNDAARRSLVLDAAVALVQWQRSQNLISLEDYRVRFLDLLRQRSQIKAHDATTLPSAIPDHLNPMHGHGTRRFSLSHIHQGSDNDLGFSFRPAIHDIRDRETGYRPGAGIAFLDIQARWDRRSEKLKIDSFDLLKIESLAPRNILMNPYSWRLNVGAKRADPLDHETDLQAFFTLGGGVSYRTRDGQWLGFATAESIVSHDRSSSQNYADMGWRLGAQWRPTPHLSTTLTVHDWFSRRFTQADRLVQLDLAIYLAKDASLQFQHTAHLFDRDREPVNRLSIHWLY